MKTEKLPWKEDDNYIVHSDGRIYSSISKKFLCPVLSSGYLAVNLRKNNVTNKPRMIRVHRMVALTFVPNEDPEEFTLVDHIDQDRLNNCYTNLRWVSGKENSQNVRNLAFNVRGVQQYTQEGELVAVFDSATTAANTVGCSPDMVTHCCAGRAAVARGKDGTYHKWKYTEIKKKIDIPEGSKLIDGYSIYYVTTDGNVYSAWIKRFMKLQLDRDGYTRINLMSKAGKRHHHIHRLVAEAFLDKPDDHQQMQVNHRDGDKSNNHMSNLEYVTSSENCSHKNYTLQRGGCKEVEMIDPSTGEVVETFLSVALAAQHVQKTQGAVANVCRGIRKTSGGYSFRYTQK